MNGRTVIVKTARLRLALAQIKPDNVCVYTGEHDGAPTLALVAPADVGRASDAMFGHWVMVESHLLHHVLAQITTEKVCICAGEIEGGLTVALMSPTEHDPIHLNEGGRPPLPRTAH